jgi:hypothetical protein
MRRCAILARAPIRVAAVLTLALALSGCVTVRMYNEGELAAVGRTCGFAPGEVVQETEEPRLLFLYSVGPPRERLACIARWSRRHALHLVYVQAVNGGSR